MAKLRMMGMCAAIVLTASLGGCQIWHVPEDQPRAAQSAPALPPPTAQPQPAPQQPAPSMAAPGVTVSEAPPPPASPLEPPEDPNAVVVRGQQERQVAPPEGDPRPASVRAAHVRAWDRCVMRAQGATESDPSRPALDTPEDLCARSLGMAGRNAIPDSWEP